jgi:hypothetical protein
MQQPPDEILNDAALALQADWQLQLPETISEEAILRLLAEKIVAIIERGPDAFYRLMYRLDISEKKLTAVLHDSDAAAKIARLIYDRQLEKVKSRHEHRMKRQNDDPELQW